MICIRSCPSSELIISLAFSSIAFCSGVISRLVGFFHDYTAKLSGVSYPWSQNIVSIGLLKVVQGRWCCLALAFRFYFIKKDIESETINTVKAGATVTSQTKLAQAAQMLVVCDSWFGNDGLLRPLRNSGFSFHMLSRLRANICVYDLPPKPSLGQHGCPRKYSEKFGSVTDLANICQDRANTHAVFLYDKRR